jgi:uncharacterized membrane protein
MQILTLLPWADWLAVAWFFAAWLGYTRFARWHTEKRPSLLVTTNVFRRQWMQMAVSRDPRVLDGIINQSMSSTPAFFSSTTIIIIGGLFALLGATDRAAELVREIPFAIRTTVLVFDLKVLVIIGIFIYAFFRFSWSMRQYTFVAMLIGAMPHPRDVKDPSDAAAQYAERACNMVSLAAETFGDGLRAYYMSFAAMAWFFSPYAFALATVVVVLILYNRDFRSDVLKVLQD